MTSLFRDLGEADYQSIIDQHAAGLLTASDAERLWEQLTVRFVTARAVLDKRLSSGQLAVLAALSSYWGCGGKLLKVWLDSEDEILALGSFNGFRKIGVAVYPASSFGNPDLHRDDWVFLALLSLWCGEKMPSIGALARAAKKQHEWTSRALKRLRDAGYLDANDMPMPGGAPFKRRAVDLDVRGRVFARDGHCCVYCGAKDGLQVDHDFPVSRGGDNAEDNLLTACFLCNVRKGNKTRAEFEKGLTR